MSVLLELLAQRARRALDRQPVQADKTMQGQTDLFVELETIAGSSGC
jgi:hypothetical protein